MKAPLLIPAVAGLSFLLGFSLAAYQVDCPGSLAKAPQPAPELPEAASPPQEEPPPSPTQEAAQVDVAALLERDRRVERDLRRRAEEAEGVLAELQRPALDHPALGISGLTQARLQAVLTASRPAPGALLQGLADLPSPTAVREVERILGPSEVARLKVLLEEEFTRHGRNHARWRRADPLAQRLHWYLSAVP